jgi:hypothetical protein
MRPRAAFSVVALIAAAFVLVGPVLAQDPPIQVAYGGVGFRFDRSLGPSVNISDVAGTPQSDLAPPEPNHIAFGLYDSTVEGDRVDRVGWGDFILRFYPVSDISDYAESSKNLAQLQSILSQRPDLAPYMAAAHVGYLPYAPVPQAAQVLRARVHYIDTPQLSGVAYVTAWSQDVTAFAAGDFWYTFQGLSSDKSWYVSVDVVINASMFPKTVSPSDSTFANGRAYEAYLDQSIARLNSAGPRKFSPSLIGVNDIINSISFDSVAASASPSEPAFPPPSPSEPAFPPSSPSEPALPAPSESVHP